MGHEDILVCVLGIGNFSPKGRLKRGGLLFPHAIPFEAGQVATQKGWPIRKKATECRNPL
ncbi:MAG: hypothetical protein N2327_02290 [Caldimicrobium sp.]|nr:hypothetical protein [Caldimicrobium sp.]